MPDPDRGRDQARNQHQDPAPRRKKPRRFTAEPQRVSESSLVGVFELPHGAGRPATGVPGERATTPADGDGGDGGKDAQHERGSTAGHGRAAKEPVAAHAEPLLEQRAAEDSPRAWGDSEDDLGEWMKSQRPPHWD